ncbi:MAG: endonuclease MutS2 [Ignavibacteriaceae bacterium]|nr:endonuclease MutS2 [Ignavibacteriaceae bacterium]
MIPSSVTGKLEFGKILSYIRKYAVTDSGKNYIESLEPVYNFEYLTRTFLLIEEAKSLLLTNTQIPLEYHPDLSEDLLSSGVSGMILKPEKILSILRLLQNSRIVSGFMKNLDNEIPGLKQQISGITSNSTLEHHIQSILSDTGEVKDSASRELRGIREDIRKRSRDLRVLFDRLRRTYIEEELIREDYITLREGRFVLPVKAEYKRQIKGFIHSESATGQTVYIEPEEALALNNEIVSLSYAEKREVERILMELTFKIGEFSTQLAANLSILAELDSYIARAQYALRVNGVTPVLKEYQTLSLLQAKNPMLIESIGFEKTIPISVDFSKCRTIIISGPNAGGKTAALKTVGLLLIMLKSGIQIPVSPDSIVGNFNSLFIEIGDNQSIEENLSTFSSHLLNLNRIINEAVKGSIVLLDELGNGTEPNAGSGIASAVLLRLLDNGAYTLATTHHSKLKALAELNPEIENAGFDFDLHTLKPTYILKQGLPGLSYAFELAGKLGFDEEFIFQAKSFAGKETINSEDALIQVRILQEKLKESENKFSVQESRISGLEKLYKQKVDDIEYRKDEILARARKQAERIVESSKSDMNKVLKELKQSKGEKSAVKKVIAAGDDILNKIKEESCTKPQPEVVEVTVGEFMKIRGTNTTGKVIEVDPFKKRATVLTGSLRLDTDYASLEKISQPGKKDTEVSLSSAHHDATSLSYRLDIRGARPEEIRLELTKFIDNSYAGRMERIEILHGKGTGALKALVKEILSTHPGVSKFYFASPDFGGDGITIAEFT